MQGVLFLYLLLAAAFVDLKRREIPDWVSGGIAALFLMHAQPECLLGLIPALFFLVAAVKGGIGGGDVKLAAAGCLDGNGSRINASASVSYVLKVRVAVFQKAGKLCVSNGSIPGDWIRCRLLYLGGVGK